ncbi:MAG: hypothetical protein HQL95_01980 [Magnetococcales bacterium]|nr:hypothetical protein [Magnetococcales bacterium]
MVTIHINGAQYHFDSLQTAEREALAHLYELHTEVMRAKRNARKLDGLLFATPYRNREEEKAAHLREEVRLWHDLRRVATHTRHQGE